jgi:seryl-tRNA synthetase
VTALAILTAITGVGLWQIKEHVEKKMEVMVAGQFEEPKIHQIVEEAAATRANQMMREQIQPEVDRFKTEISNRLSELDKLVSKTKDLEKQSQGQEAAIQDILKQQQALLSESQQIRDKMVGLQSDVIKMQKCFIKIQYFKEKGRNTFPNPYEKDILDALNEMISIAVPDPVERGKFINDLGGPNL